jgi:hypothetical protein
MHRSMLELDESVPVGQRLALSCSTVTHLL